MQHQQAKPPSTLRDVIQDFWYISRDFGELPTSFEVAPDGYAEIIFYFGRGCSIATPEGLQLLSSPFLVGLLNRPVYFYAQNRLQIIGVKCFPWAVPELLGLPASKGGVHSIVHPIAQLQATLAACIEAGKIEEALTEAAHYFGQARLRVANNQLLGKAGAAMREAHGTLPVSQVAAAAHATVRTLERKFKLAAGHTVKDVSGLMRFEQARNHLWQHPAASLAGLAQELGYTD
jgi:AraC-like DNA-binding protein